LVARIEAGRTRTELGLLFRTLDALGLHLEIRVKRPRSVTRGGPKTVDLDALLHERSRSDP
jgi:7,8-dihydro-6-hydroxymethylpterin-pyrophosphokinase